MKTIEIKKIIDSLRCDGYFSLIEDRPEDFIDGRTDWGDLSDNYRKLYYSLREIEELCR